MGKTYDFAGWATRNDLRCADGRVIRKDAFKDNDGKTVPLVWNHNHSEVTNVIGHALLENRGDGVYAYCSLNDTPTGKHAKEIIRHGDVEALSIWANNLKQHGSDVFHGVIRELSLVLAGANPGAYIEDVELAHGEDGDGSAVIYNDCELTELYHSDEDDGEGSTEPEQPKEGEEPAEGEKENPEGEDGKPEPEKEPEQPKEGEEPAEGEEGGELSHSIGDDFKNVMKKLDKKDQQTVAMVLGMAVADSEENEGGEEMKHNAFDKGTKETVVHSINFGELLETAKKEGSLKAAVLVHAAEFEESADEYIAHAYPHNEDGSEQTYGVANIHWLFPEARMTSPTPEWIKRDDDWVAGVINGVHHTPFSRIKSMYADITADEARAKGYTKGKKKIEEVFTLLKRSTTPQTIYKKQKLDRDDIIDITDFDVVAWIRVEMRFMLEEEIARAILVGDGRSTADDDHISHEHVRPVWLDDELFTIKHLVAEPTPSNVIDEAVRARVGYKGSGQPTLYTTEAWITEMLLLKDQMGHRLYKTMEELATAMRVKNIVPVPVMENLTRTVGEGAGAKIYELIGLIVNLRDYTVGADKGGAVSLFDDFDIDYNQQKYLIETRISGAMTKPKAAIALEQDVTDSF